jgi:hypothetical protein
MREYVLAVIVGYLIGVLVCGLVVYNSPTQACPPIEEVVDGDK